MAEKCSAASIRRILLNFNRIEGGHPLLLPRVTVYASEMSSIPDEKDVRKEAAATVSWAYFPSIERENAGSFPTSPSPPFFPRREWNVRDTHTRAVCGRNIASKIARRDKHPPPPFSSRDGSADPRFDLTFAHSRLFTECSTKKIKISLYVHQWRLTPP